MCAAGLTLILADTSDYHRRLLRAHVADYDPATRLMLELGEFVTASAYLTAQRARALFRGAIRQAFADYRLDAMAAPTAPTTTMPLEQLSVSLGADAGETALSAFLHHNIPSNLSGQPALSIPCGFSSEDLPTGLQLIGRPLGEQRLFRIATGYEQAHPWHERKPAIAQTEGVRT
jgi:aspartyl-tRNA(Asn)/glutamyl-tRNA(Gln) amidotransferase subunit A